MRESLDIYQAIKKTHGTGILLRRILCGDYLGQIMHQQIRAAATCLNAYTGRHNRECTHAQCPNKKETNRLETGVNITSANYVDIMALNAKKLDVQPETLAKALCRLLAHITKKHQRENNNVSVATTLESNQRRSIIRTTPSEQPPD